MVDENDSNDSIENEQNSEPFDYSALLVAVGLVLLIVVGAFILTDARKKPPVSFPTIVWIVSLLGTAALLVPLRFTVPTAVQSAINRVINNYRLVLLILSQWFIVYLLWRIPQYDWGRDDYFGLVLCWIAAFLIYLVAVWQKGTAESPITFSRNIWLALGGIMAVAFLVRLWHLSTIPFAFSGDEAEQGMEAIKIIEGRMKNPFHTGWLGVPTMSFWFNSFSIQAFGRTIFGLRFPWTVVGTLTIPLAFLLTVRIKRDALFALCTAALVAAYHYHIHFSRLGSNQIADPFFLTLALWLFYRAIQRENRIDWALCGGAIGLAFYFYAGARLTLVIILALVAYYLICDLFSRQKTFIKKHGLGVLIMLGGFLIVSAPMLQYGLQLNPGEFNARINQVGIYQSGWVEREIASGRTPFDVYSKQLADAALFFHIKPDKTVWYGLEEPMLTPLFSMLFGIGLLYSTFHVFRFKSHKFAPFVAWWWGGMLTAGFLTTDPPNSQRMVTLTVPVCLFIALTLWLLGDFLTRAFRSSRVRTGLMIGGVALFSILSLHQYFVEFMPRQLTAGARAHFATQISTPLNELVPEHRAYFVGAPWAYWGFGTLKYLVGEEHGMDMGEDRVTPINLAERVDKTKPAVFIVTPERTSELDVIKQTYPDGTTETFTMPDGRFLGTMYIVETSER